MTKTYNILWNNIIHFFKDCGLGVVVIISYGMRRGPTLYLYFYLLSCNLLTILNKISIVHCIFFKYIKNVK